MNKKTKIGLFVGVIAMMFCFMPALVGCGEDADKIAELNSQIATLQTQNNNVAAERDTYKAERDAYKAESDAYKAQNDKYAALNTEMIATFTRLFDKVATLTINPSAGVKVGFDEMVDMGKNVKVALGKKQLSCGEVYKAVVQTGTESKEIPFKLAYEKDVFHVYYLGSDGENALGNRYSFIFVNGAIQKFEIYINGKLKHISESITDNVCSDEIPNIAFSNTYDPNAVIAELSATIDATHQITITQAEKDAI